MSAGRKTVNLEDLQEVYRRSGPPPVAPKSDVPDGKFPAPKTEAKPKSSVKAPTPKKPAVVEVVSGAEEKSLLSEIEAVVGQVAKTQESSSRQLEALELAKRPDLIAKLRHAASVGFEDAEKKVREYDLLMEEGKKNPFTQRKIAVAELIGKIEVGDIHYVSAIAKGVEIKALRYVVGEKVDSSKRLTYYETRGAKQIMATLVPSDGDTEKLVVALQNYKEAKKNELVDQLEAGTISAELAAAEGVKLQVGRCEFWERAKEKNYPRVRFDHIHCFVPWPLEKGDPEYNRESQQFYRNLLAALSRERDLRGEKIRPFMLPEEEVKEAGSIRRLIEGEAGEVVMTDTFKTRDGDVKFGVKVVRSEIGHRLEIVQISNEVFAKKVFAKTNRSGDVKCTSVTVEYDFKQENGKFSKVVFRAVDNRLERMLQSAFEKEVPTPEDLEMVRVRQEEIRDILREKFRVEINREATIAPADILKKSGKAAICRDDWKIREGVELKYVDALLENTGRKIRVLKSSPRVRNYIFEKKGVPEELSPGEVPKRIFAWVVGAKDMRASYPSVETEE